MAPRCVLLGACPRRHLPAVPLPFSGGNDLTAGLFLASLWPLHWTGALIWPRGSCPLSSPGPRISPLRTAERHTAQAARPQGHFQGRHGGAEGGCSGIAPRRQRPPDSLRPCPRRWPIDFLAPPSPRTFAWIAGTTQFLQNSTVLNCEGLSQTRPPPAPPAPMTLPACASTCPVAPTQSCGALLTSPSFYREGK